MSEANTALCVRDVMQTKFDVIDCMSSVADALRIMQSHPSATLIVEKKHTKDEYGMLLISDIARHVIAKDRNPERVNVYEIMVKPVLTADPNMSIKNCSLLLQRFEVTRAPVLEDRKVIGLVSFDDLVLKGLCREL